MEELKLILETVAALGAEAKWAFMAWLAYKAFTVFATVGTILTVVFLVVRGISRANDDTAVVRQLADAFEHRYYDTRGLVTKILAIKPKSSSAD